MPFRDTHLCHSLFRKEEAFDNLTRQALKRSRSWPSLSVIVNIFSESPVSHHSNVFFPETCWQIRIFVNLPNYGYKYTEFASLYMNYRNFLYLQVTKHVKILSVLFPAGFCIKVL